VNINKAYSHWGFLYSYSSDLQNHSVDLIQLFPRGGHCKNGADIRMAIDVIEDLALNPHITTVVIVGGDSDYISIAQKVRQKGRSIIGIGIKETTNQYWIKACNEFKFYSSLLVKSSAIDDVEAEGYEAGDIHDAKELLARAVARIAAETGENYAKKAAVKPMMVRLDPSFDETNYGSSSFREFLDRCADVVNIFQGIHDHHVSLRNSKVGPILSTFEPLHPYASILKKQQIRLVDPLLLQACVRHTFDIFHEEGYVESFDEYRERLACCLTSEDTQFVDADLSKVKGILFKAFCFQTDQERRVVRLAEGIESAEALEDRIVRTMAKRVADNFDEEVDPAAFAELFLGDAFQASRVRRLIEAFEEVGPEALVNR
jgi:hypothetical protein